MNVQPQFRTVVRGFDPDQVASTVKDLYTALTIARRTAADRTLDLAAAQEEIERLRSALETSRSQAAEAGSATSTHGYDDLGERIGTMLRLAEEEAAQLKETSEGEARLVRESADSDAMRMRSAAQASADEILQRANEDATSRRQEAERLVEERRTLLDQAEEDVQRQLAERADQAEAMLAEDRARHQERVDQLRVEADGLANHQQEIRRSAEEEAAAVVAQARAESEDLRAAAQAELVDLREDHQRIRGQLERLHGVLAELLAQTPDYGAQGDGSVQNGSREPAPHPSPTDLPGHGRWFLERVSPPRGDGHAADETWHDVFDRRDNR